MSMQKLVSLAAVLGRDPQEFVDRVGAIARGRLEPLRRRAHAYAALDWDDARRIIGTAAGDEFSAALEESALKTVQTEVRARSETLRGGPIDERHNGNQLLGICCYALARVLRPRIIVETGVAHGVTSAHFLAALAENGAGELHSIDLPPHNTGAEARVGACIPDHLKSRWHLHRGMSRRMLPRVLARVRRADIFLHDSMHTYDNMRFEFELAWPGARAIIADDIELNGAFAEVAARGGSTVVVRQADKDSLFGVIVR